MENLQIKITITDGEKEAKTIVNANDYLNMKNLHGVSLLDLQVDTLLEEINKPITPKNIFSIK
jgi:hypothetical protein